VGKAARGCSALIAPPQPLTSGVVPESRVLISLETPNSDAENPEIHPENPIPGGRAVSLNPVRPRVSGEHLSRYATTPPLRPAPSANHAGGATPRFRRGSSKGHAGSTGDDPDPALDAPARRRQATPESASRTTRLPKKAVTSEWS